MGHTVSDTFTPVLLCLIAHQYRWQSHTTALYLALYGFLEGTPDWKNTSQLPDG